MNLSFLNKVSNVISCKITSIIVHVHVCTFMYIHITETKVHANSEDEPQKPAMWMAQDDVWSSWYGSVTVHTYSYKQCFSLTCKEGNHPTYIAMWESIGKGL